MLIVGLMQPERGGGREDGENKSKHPKYNSKGKK